jgi:hypothetical protein
MILMIAAAFFALGSPDALAQRGGFGFRGSTVSTSPEYTRRDMQLFVDHLELDHSQKVIVETLLLDYISSYEAAVAARRESLDELQPERTEEEEAEREAQREQRRELFREMRDVRDAIEQMEQQAERGNVSRDVVATLEARLEALSAEQEELRNQSFDRERFEAEQDARAALDKWLLEQRTRLGREFVQNVQMVLSEQQLQKWTTLEQLMRRLKTLRRGQLSGERVDLFHVLRDAQIDPSEVEQLGELMASYGYDLDQALVLRNAYLERSRDESRQASREGDLKKVVSIAEKESRLRVQVRGANQQYADAITGLLGESKEARTFRERYRMMAFGRIYRPTAMLRTFEKAMEIEGLEAETMALIVNLEESYLLNLAQMNDQAIAAVVGGRRIRSARHTGSATRWTTATGRSSRAC